MSKTYRRNKPQGKGDGGQKPPTPATPLRQHYQMASEGRKK